MPIYPGAINRPLKINHGGARSRTRAVVLHVDAGGADSLFGWFSNPAANASSHFYVKYDGTVEQYLDTNLTAWTQRDGNSSCIGIETQGKGDGEWTAQQMASIVKLLAWVCDTHSIPKRDMGNALPSSKGIGMHRYGIAPYAVKGAETWGPQAKACPGEKRVKQFPQIISRLTGQEEDDMPTPAEIANAVLNTKDPALGGRTVHQHLAVLPALTADAVLNYKHPVLGKTIIQALADVVGRMAGIEAIAASDGYLTQAQISEASSAGVRQAFGDAFQVK